ncbi:glycosyl hydrolase 5 family protein-like [Dioscorea cayenensis subsp. rotundata]|uniref:Glycosyl hydrolase 5 family protein-like n=1 Tax=Dioscorea cayennensis subsp. rotundata TaxID=55577 RepID=A0AB40C340_DIOCR|nr:glycosyl hydrolase 5 family protein-like [Dioscorea cayenensis subsp. rotundata]
MTVRESLIFNGLNDVMKAISLLNPEIINLPLIQVFQTVIESLGKYNIMVILDNHRDEQCGGHELKGPKQNTQDWYKYMQQGAEQVSLTFKGKLVFEFHWYSFANRQGWESGNLNQVCSASSTDVYRKVGFLLDQYPLFMSEFGINQDGQSIGDNYYIGCLLAFTAERDIDWNPGFMATISSIVPPLREAWGFNGNGLAFANGSTNSCLEVLGNGQGVQVGNSTICGGPSSKWKTVSPTNMQFSSQQFNLCLDVNPDGKTLVTNPCLCLDGCSNCNPESQWFKLVNSTRQIIM